MEGRQEALVGSGSFQGRAACVLLPSREHRASLCLTLSGLLGPLGKEVGFVPPGTLIN